MRFLEKLRNLLKPGTKEFGSFQELLERRFGIKEFILATAEGLPISGTLDSVEELSAELPELRKKLSSLEPSDDYIVISKEGIYLILAITDDVVMLAKTEKIPTWERLREIKEATGKELNLL
ncbi:hypothetical protein [Thermococcus sp. MV11]|uniref:hypothetical protein n=1 Tax=Thermococcus sp. MV11 TaxID=1638267 RepID=UPI0014313300|nr:hypothetical protein [Thermococcus sp. MV11]NJE03393.1 hypothetical protein [Thermococcus sp. MV11]